MDSSNLNAPRDRGKYIAVNLPEGTDIKSLVDGLARQVPTTGSVGGMLWAIADTKNGAWLAVRVPSGRPEWQEVIISFYRGQFAERFPGACTLEGARLDRVTSDLIGHLTVTGRWEIYLGTAFEREIENANG